MCPTITQDDFWVPDAISNIISDSCRSRPVSILREYIAYRTILKTDIYEYNFALTEFRQGKN